MRPGVICCGLPLRFLGALLICPLLLAVPNCRRTPTGKPPQPLNAAADVPKPGMQLPFTEVKRFSRPAVFVAYSEWLEHMDVSRDDDLIQGVRLSQGSVRNAGIAVKPDGSEFYLATKTDLLRCNSQAEVIQRIPVSAFDLGGAEFIWDAVASDEYLWLTSTGGSSGSAIVEWRLDRPPATRLVVRATQPVHIAVDAEKRHVYLPFSGGLVNFERAAFEDVAWARTGEYYFADFDPARGLLLSSHPMGTTTTIVHVNPATGERNSVTDGSYAVWGPEGWVYFCVGDTELWRCRSDGSQRDVVFTGMRGENVPSGGFAIAPRFDWSRSRLAYTYYFNAGVGGPVSGILLIDFGAQEYRILDNKYRSNFAWIVNAGEAASEPAP